VEKTYSNRSNAARAAKKAGLEKFSIIEVDGKFSFEDATPTPAPAPEKAQKAAKPPKATKAPKVAKVAKAPAKARKVARVKDSAGTVCSKATEPRGAKSAQLIDLVTQGATISELTETLGWLPHTVRAALSRLGKAGYSVQRTKVGTADDGFESHYKIAS
jgi:Protein of unknown function (DUF3489)